MRTLGRGGVASIVVGMCLLCALIPGLAGAQWLSGYAEGENDIVNSLTWVDEPVLGDGVAFVGHTLSYTSDFQTWLGMTDAGGAVLWERLYGEGESYRGKSIAVVSGVDGIVKSLVVAGSKGWDGWLLEVESSSGDPIRQCEYDDLGPLESVIATKDGEFVFVGRTNGGTVCGLVVAKTQRTPNDPCGLAWARVFAEGDGGSDWAVAITRTSDDGFAVAGWTHWYSAQADGIVLKLASNGEPQWQSRVSFGGSIDGDLQFMDLIEARDSENNPDGFLAVGYVEYFEPGFGLDSNMVLTRLEADGSERWTRFVGYPDEGGELATARAVAQVADGEFVVAGEWNLDPPLVEQDLVFLKLKEQVDGAGEPLVTIKWQREVNGEAAGAPEPMFSWATDLQESPGGGLIASGYFSSSFSGGDENAWLMRMNDEGEIPTDCLVDADPPLEMVSHDYLFEQVDDEPVAADYLGTVTMLTPVKDGPLRRYDCRPCVVRVNRRQVINAPDGETWETAYTDLQQGIDAAYAEILEPTGAVGYCEVWVAQGDYHSYVSAATDTIHLRPGVHVFGGFEGGDPPVDYGWEGSREDRDWELNVTRILGIDPSDTSPNPAKVHHVVTGASRSTLDGFHVAGGYADGGAGLPRFGGGMLNYGVSPRVRNCTFYSNMAWWGGAMANIFGAPEVTNCFFTSMPNEPLLGDKNTALLGGAMLDWGWDVWTGDGPIIDGCEIEDGFAYYYGGGVFNRNSPARISNSLFGKNSATMGGGIANEQTLDGMGAPFIEACEFDDNEAMKWDEPSQGVGAAMATVSGMYVWSSEVNVENSLFHRNSAGDPEGSTLFFYVAREPATPWVVNCTIANNESGGIVWASFFGSYPPLVGNTILWSNGPYEIMPDCEGGAAVVFSDVMGGGGCDMYAGNIDENPFFVSSGYKLDSYSTCIDAGESWFAPLTDITGAYRDLSPDMGAYEYFVE